MCVLYSIEGRKLCALYRIMGHFLCNVQYREAICV